MKKTEYKACGKTAKARQKQSAESGENLKERRRKFVFNRIAELNELAMQTHQ